jgi:hypothetical protein
MASKTSASVGIMVFLAIVSVIALGLFVTSIVFFARTQRLNNELTLKQNDLDAAVRGDERDDRWEELKRLSGNSKGVVRFLDENLRETTMLVSGSRRDTPAALLEKLNAAAGENKTPLLQLLATRDTEITNLTGRVRDAESARDAARADLQAQVDRIASMQKTFEDSKSAMQGEIDSYRKEVEAYRTGVDTAKTSMDTRVTRIQTDSDATTAALESRVNTLEQELLVANEQIRKLRAERSADSLGAQNEATLIDGRIVSTNPAAREVYLDLGKKHRIVLGMTFEVYTNASAIKADEQGNYPKGKATIEITRVLDDNSSIARIVREVSGNPVIAADVIANAVFDPRKVYSFVVFGNFDFDGDSVATPQETQNIKGIIESWNGRISDDITGDTDFVVLGEKPILPPQPKPTDPVELTERYILLRQQVTRYDSLLERAGQAGIPILNQNRLYTLTGGLGR